MTIQTWGLTPFTVREPYGTDRIIFVRGRDRWALESLIRAGDRGCTPIDHPGPRWSAYVHDLRHEHGLNIETVTEEHGPPFGGTHARYVLRSAVAGSQAVEQ